MKVLAIPYMPYLRTLPSGVTIHNAAQVGKKQVEFQPGDALHLIELHQPDVVFIDVTYKAWRNVLVSISPAGVPTIGLVPTADTRSQSDLRISFLSAGGHVLLWGPVNGHELHESMLALVRLRHHTSGNGLIKFLHGGTPIAVDLRVRQVYVMEKQVPVSRQSFMLLRMLALHAGQALSHERLHAHVFGERLDGGPTSDALRVRIHHLRTRLAEGGVREPKQFVMSVYTHGYVIPESARFMG